MKKIVILISFVFCIILSINSNTIYSNKSGYDVFSEFMNEHFDYCWPGRSYDFYENNNEKSIFIIILGDQINDEFVKKNFGDHKMTESKIREIIRGIVRENLRK